MTEKELQHQSELADARLSVAEDLCWPIAILASVTVNLMWDNWLLTVAAFVASYFLVVFKYRRTANMAEDEYYRVAKLGKYMRSSKAEDT